MTPVTSSTIHSIGHDPANNETYVRFKNRTDGSPGALWAYGVTTPEEHAAFANATPSVGSHFHAHIKSIKQGRRVE